MGSSICRTQSGRGPRYEKEEARRHGSRPHPFGILMRSHYHLLLHSHAHSLTRSLTHLFVHPNPQHQEVLALGPYVTHSFGVFGFCFGWTSLLASSAGERTADGRGRRPARSFFGKDDRPRQQRGLLVSWGGHPGGEAASGRAGAW